MHFAIQSPSACFLRSLMLGSRVVRAGSRRGARAGAAPEGTWNPTQRVLHQGWLTAATRAALVVISSGAVSMAAGAPGWSFAFPLLGFGAAVRWRRRAKPWAGGPGRSRAWAAWAAVAALIGAGASAAVVMPRRGEAPAMLRSSLNLDALPRSTRDISCTSYGFSDVLVICAFTIHPHEFAAVIRGWDFQPGSCAGMSHGATGGPPVGRNFAVAHCYIANPEEFEHGGAVRVFADRDRRRVMAELYIE